LEAFIGPGVSVYVSAWMLYFAKGNCLWETVFILLPQNTYSRYEFKVEFEKEIIPSFLLV
jgi:hypothetical protein